MLTLAAQAPPPVNVPEICRFEPILPPVNVQFGEPHIVPEMLPPVIVYG